jgi:transcriptional regulator with XRE-family HTH domain
MAVRRTGLARARKAAGFTQEKFAEATHVEPTTVGRWEAGTREPLPYKRPLIARLLEISMNELDELLHPEVGSVAVTQRVTEPAVPAQDMTAVAELLGPAHAIDLLDTYARSVIARYELEGRIACCPSLRSVSRSRGMTSNVSVSCRTAWPELPRNWAISASPNSPLMQLWSWWNTPILLEA